MWHLILMMCVMTAKGARPVKKELTFAHPVTQIFCLTTQTTNAKFFVLLWRLCKLGTPVSLAILIAKHAPSLLMFVTLVREVSTLTWTILVKPNVLTVLSVTQTLYVSFVIQNAQNAVHLQLIVLSVHTTMSFTTLNVLTHVLINLVQMSKEIACWLGWFVILGTK